MTRAEALLQLFAIAFGLPPGTPEEKAARAAERLAAHENVEMLRAVLLELALRHLVVEAGGGR